MNSRQGRLVLGLALILFLSTLLAYSHWSDKRSRAQKSLSSAINCEALADHITTIHNNSSQGGNGELTNIEITKRIRAASTSAGVSRSDITQIDLSTPKPVPRSSYHRSEVTMKIRLVSLRQTLALLWKIIEKMPQLHIDDISLNEPPEKVGSKWNVDVRMSFLIFKP